MADPKTTTEADPDEKVRVKVVVAPRETYPGYWAAGRQWMNGETEAVVTRDELRRMKEKKGGFAVVELGPAPKEATGSGTPTGTAAELAAKGQAGANYDPRTAASPLGDADAMQSGQSADKGSKGKR